jgi:hypothetical protein
MQLITPPATAHRDFPSSGTLAEFRTQFQELHQGQPFKAVRMFFYYLSSRGVDAAAHAMAFWVTSGSMYISMLLDMDLQHEDTLTPQMISIAIARLPKVDPQFLIKFARSVGELKDPNAIVRALRLAAALEDAGILIPWLRSLGEHEDSRVRSSAAKLLCQIRPNKGLIQRHLQSRDARVRAGVTEALWNAKIARSNQDVLTLLRNAVDDPNHRVVANALVGLYRLGEDQALDRMIALCSTKQQLFRAAMAWALGAVNDIRVVPVLQGLSFDPSFTVRQRARDSLRTLGFMKTVENGNEDRSALAVSNRF